MLAHSPPLPLIINHLNENDYINTKDEEGLIYALQQCDHVRRIRLVKPVSILEKLYQPKWGISDSGIPVYLASAAYDLAQ